MKFIKNFAAVGIKDVSLVGGKNASLGEMIQNLEPKGILIPGGFVVTADAYWHHIKQNNLVQPITELLSKVNLKKSQ